MKEKRFSFIKRHWDTVDAITKKHGMYFYNMYDMFGSSDNLFPDDLHLNAKEAGIFTAKLLGRMKEDGVFQRANTAIAALIENGLPQR